MIDSTIVRAHQHSAGAEKKPARNQAIGRSRGGLSTKIHAQQYVTEPVQGRAKPPGRRRIAASRWRRTAICVQHAADMRADLQRLKRDTDTGRAVAASSGTVAAAQDSASSSAAAPAAPPPAPDSAAALASIPFVVLGKGGCGCARAAKWWKIVVPVVALLAAIAAGFFFYTRRSQALTEKDSILLADFVNTTGDPSSTEP